MTAPGHTYRSSSDKHFIRNWVDLPLLERLHSIRGNPLNYFGLPGAELEDVKSWKHLLGQVAAVERSRRNLSAMDETVSMEMPDLRFTPHFGEIDVIILRDRGKGWQRGGEVYRPWVRISRPDSGHLGWYFDVVNLDYFGPFLPEGDQPARQRADAIRKLFDIERLDSWGRWVLLVTVEAQLVTELSTQLEDYLRGVQNDSSQMAASIIEFLSQPATDVREGATAARLIHAVSASLVARSASQANLSAFPRGTILYRGSGGQPMVHLAYEFEPLVTPLSPPSPLLQLLKGPLLSTSQSDSPELTLLDEQVPSLTEDDVRTAVDFLEKTQVERLVAQLS